MEGEVIFGVKEIEPERWSYKGMRAQWSSSAGLGPWQSFHQLLGPVLFPLQQMRETPVQTLVTLNSIWSLSTSAPITCLGSFLHGQSHTPPIPRSTILLSESFPVLSSQSTLTWCLRYCVSNGKQRTSPSGQGCSLIPMVSDILSPVAASFNFASYKSKNIVIFSLMWKILQYSITAAIWVFNST